MRNLYSILFAAMTFVPLTASAGFDLPEENAVLESEEYGYSLEKNYDFVGGNFNGQPMSVSGNGCFVLSADKADFKLNNFDSFQVTAPEEMTNFYIQIGTAAINLRSGVGKDGLHNYGSGPRWFAMSDMREGQIIVLQHSENTTDGKGNATTIKPNASTPDQPTEPLQVEDITEEIHSIQDLVDADSDGNPDQVHDTFHYWRVLVDGYVYVEMERNTYIQGIQIWSKNDAPEAVSSPSLKMVGVNGDARKIEFKSGVSTYGNEVKTYYAFEGDDPVYLKDSEEIDHYEYTYEVDAEGNPVLDENGNPVKSDSTAVYKQVIDLEAVAEADGEYGDYLFNPDDGAVNVSANDDEDGDGIVMVKAASVSSEGTLSQIVTINVNIGEIQLNAPTLTLVNFSGKERAYKIGWTNNTLCGEDYNITYETGEGSFYEFEPNTGIGEIVSSAQSLTITVKVDGYTNGVCELSEVHVAGVDVNVKEGIGNGMNPEEHNWDFCVFTEEVRQMINEEVVDRYVIRDDEGNVVKEYTVEQVEGDEVPAEEIDKLEKIIKYFGWDGGDSSRNPNRHWRTWVPEYEVIDDAVTENIISTAYAEDQTGLLKGLVADNDHPKYSSMAIFTTGEGLYYMSKGTIQVEGVAYGEYVAVTTDAGTTISQHLDAENPFSVTIGSGRYVKSLDVYTYDDLPDGMECITAPSASQRTAIYNANGIEVKTPAKGMHIIRKADGTRVKVMF